MGTQVSLFGVKPAAYKFWKEAPVIGRSYHYPVVLTPEKGFTHVSVDSLIPMNDIFKQVYGGRKSYHVKKSGRQLKALKAKQLIQEVLNAQMEIHSLSEALAAEKASLRREQARFEGAMEVVREMVKRDND
jgi:hypothetical protein